MTSRHCRTLEHMGLRQIRHFLYRKGQIGTLDRLDDRYCDQGWANRCNASEDRLFRLLERMMEA